jgi:hypothetical protein
MFSTSRKEERLCLDPTFGSKLQSFSITSTCHTHTTFQSHHLQFQSKSKLCAELNTAKEDEIVSGYDYEPRTFQGAPSTSRLEPTLISLLESAYTRVRRERRGRGPARQEEGRRSWAKEEGGAVAPEGERWRRRREAIAQLSDAGTWQLK